MEDDLILFYRSLIKYFARNVFESEINPFAFRFFLNFWEQSHLKFKSENIYFCYLFFNTFVDNRFNKQTRGGQIDRAYGNKTRTFLAVECFESFCCFRFVCGKY